MSYHKPHDDVCTNSQYQNPAGEWWELFDDIHNLPYYYNTKTGQTEWEKPQDSANIISLTAIQVGFLVLITCSLLARVA